MKSVIYGVAIFVTVILIAGGILLAVLFPLKQYQDNNSWAAFEISGDGIIPGETKYKCTPGINVTDSGTTKSYGKGETVILDFASFTIDKVYIGKKRGVSISSENDLSYRGEPGHKVYLTEGESCEIRAQGKMAVIKLTGITNR